MNGACGESGETHDNLALFLHYNCDEEFKGIKIKFKFSILTGDEKIKNQTNYLYHPGPSKRSFGFVSFFKKSQVINKTNAYFPDDCLTIICKITKISVDDKKSIIDIPKNKIINDLSLMIKNQSIGGITKYPNLGWELFEATKKQ
ncbi:hypothetical protein HCN44_003347 [Aphidius gifuensis]|uniref:MATH domain-containing protein n=1 Tax=Aphidius gifuensis TaxID=684658 RepID=A0A834XX68_APHGI|nr:hypothetical protein HCN44_003347 [Aphidius gifuensis]